MNYDDACLAAATTQGLDEPRETLQAAGIPCRVDQTGGFTMVLVIPDESGWELWVTDEAGDAGIEGYLVGSYSPADLEACAGTDDYAYVPLDALAAFVRTWAKARVAS